MSRYRWQIPPPHRLSGEEKVAPLLAQLLYNRGVKDPAQFEPFLAADERLRGAPFFLPDMSKAVSRIIRALLKGELIGVYGDFDVDGVTATALLTQGLSLLGGRAIPYIPHRTQEGHGLKLPALNSLRQQGVSLVITVDCGITAFAEVEQAQREGLDIIITDHHSVPISIPPAIAVIDPKRNDSDYIFCELAGVGVAFKLLEALFQTAGKERMLDEFLDLVALGTVADLVPLRGENRYLVKRGLEVLNASNRPGLRELVHQAGLEMGHLDTESISYMLGPRLNAAGRLEHGITSFKLLTVNSVEEGRQLAAELEAKNAERQRLTLEVLAEAKERLLPITPDTPLLIVGSQNFPPGVMGLVAGKLVDEFCRPAVVMEFTAETTRGSARSISEFDITSALSECSDLLSSFGGHTKAAGFTLPNANVERLQQRLLEIAKRELANFDFSPTLTIDAEIPLSSVGGETFNLVNKLAPFGQANPLPTFLSRRVKAVEHHCVGSKGEHLKLKLQDGRFAKVTWDAIGFDLGYLNNSLTPYLDIVYNLEKDNWRGEFLRLNLLDLSPIELS